MYPALANYMPVLVILAVAVVLGLLFTALSLYLGPHRPTPAKLAPYECGIIPTTQARQRFPVKFYLMAMLFIIFDIESVFLYPFAVAFNQLGLFALVEMVLFVLTVFVAYAYVWRRGGLEWD